MPGCVPPTDVHDRRSSSVHRTKRIQRAIAVEIISIHSSYNPERLGPGNYRGMARGGNPRCRTPHPNANRHASPDQGRVGNERKTYRSSDHDVPDARIAMFYRIFPIVAVDIRWVIHQSLSLVRGIRFVVDDLILELLQLVVRLGPVVRDPASFLNKSRGVRVLSAGPISLVHRRAIFNRVVKFELALFKSANKPGSPLVSIPRSFL